MKSISASIIVLASVHWCGVGFLISDNDAQFFWILTGMVVALISFVIWLRSLRDAEGRP